MEGWTRFWKTWVPSGVPRRRSQVSTVSSPGSTRISGSAFHNGQVAALGDSLDGVLEAADEKNIPRGKMVIRYLDPDPKLMIL